MTLETLPAHVKAIIILELNPSSLASLLQVSKTALNSQWSHPDYVYLKNAYWNVPMTLPGVNEDGDKMWYDRMGRLHRPAGEGPAVIYKSGTQAWYQHGELHREADQPAIIWASGGKQWFWHGETHRDNDQPAETHSDGTQCWYQHGELHREADQPAVLYANGTMKWYRDGKKHREADQPTVVKTNGTMKWYQNGELHRDNGPAITRPDGAQEWFQHGQKVSPSPTYRE